jgi:diketogulonate reductase-like aldo/keto reductase
MADDQYQLIDGTSVPRFLYGTAWKEDATQRLTELALRHGFRGIDTANQRKHYHEAAVGRAIQTGLHEGWLRREELFIQTKFTFRAGQDHRLPYDPHAPIAVQVEQSFQKSLEQLGLTTIDSYLLHGPSRWDRLGDEDWEAWQAMESLHARGLVRFLGVSNVSLEQLQQFVRGAKVKPCFVQNRCFAARGWDRTVRMYVRSQGLIYQGFSLLTANRAALAHPAVHQIARKHNCTVPQVIFRFALDVGMIPLTGTTSAQHMQEDLAVFRYQLEPADVSTIEGLFG